MKLVWLVLLAVLAAFGVSWMIETPVAIDVWVVRRQAILVTGVASFALMSLIVLLSTRPAWLERRLGGLDRMYQVHKRAGFIAIGLGITHYLLELSGPVLAGLVGRPAKGPRIPGALDAFRDMAKELGEWSVWLLAAMLIVTLWRRFPYHLWRHAHRILSLIYLALVFHGVVLMPPAYWSQPAGWLVAACAVIGTVCAVIAASGRIGRGRTFRGVVTAITPMGDQTSDVVCRLQGPWRHRPGQFAFLKCDRWEGAHPFTLSAADRGTGEVRFSIKALGDYTTRLQRGLKVGDPVQVEGPYGCFDFLGAAEGRQLWIAGGIGIAPFMAWLEALKQMPEECPDIKLLYCVRDASIAPYAARLQELCAGLPRIDLQLHSSDDEGWLRIDDLGLRWEEPWPSVWICGPTRLALHLTRELLRLGLPRKCLHQELFQMR